MMSAIRRWLGRPPTARRPRPGPYYDSFFASPSAVEDDYRRLAGNGGLPRAALPDAGDAGGRGARPAGVRYPLRSRKKILGPKWSLASGRWAAFSTDSMNHSGSTDLATGCRRLETERTC